MAHGGEFILESGNEKDDDGIVVLSSELPSNVRDDPNSTDSKVLHHVCVLCFMFCVLCFVFFVLCFVFCVLCFMFYVLCFMFYVFFMFYILCFVFFVLCFLFIVFFPTQT